ncbi:MAG TPA: hypothetical protein VML96_12680 [Egibacteraceae bacterium]|nr:hypothetical protein [Egibacteraceae bacterium]
MDRAMDQVTQPRAPVVGGPWFGAAVGDKLSLHLDFAANQPGLAMRWDARASSIVRTGPPHAAAECRLETGDAGRLQATLTRPGATGAVPVLRTFVHGFDRDRPWEEIGGASLERRYSDRTLAGELALWVARAGQSFSG